MALAPICAHCGVVITNVGGTLGLTSAYGVGDPTITRSRVEADLAVFREYRLKYEGMLEACTQQLEWGVERYAKLPNPPELLELEKVPSFWKGLGIGLLMIPVWFFLLMIIAIVLYIIGLVGNVIYEIFINHTGYLFTERHWDLILNVLGFGGVIVCVLTGPFFHFMAKAANGKKPLENARRQKAYEEAKAAALKAAERSKAAEDHRLRLQIRELEGFAKTAAAKEAEVRQILVTL
ncbi:MAG: hypothetical protein NT154_14900 [Verrucomicrobia bacterium]|nr:hypothetical protein [Verrucomicrobiota bacterium]